MATEWRIGRFAATHVSLHPTYPLLYLVVAGAGKALGLSGHAVLEVCGLVLLMSGFTILHEFGHVLVAQRHGIATLGVTLTPLGALSRLERNAPTPRAELLIGAAGPAVSLACALFFLVAARGEVGAWSDLAKNGALARLFWGNALLAGLNMLPAFPLDGGRVLAAALEMAGGARRAATRLTSISSYLVAGWFIYLGIVWDPVLLVISLLCFYSADRAWNAANAEALIKNPSVATARTWEFGFLTEEVPVMSLLDYAFTHPQRDFPVLRDGALIGLITRAAMAKGMQGGNGQATVGEVMLREVPVARLNEPLIAAVERMRSAGLKVLPVLDEAGFAGLLKLDEAAQSADEQEAQNAAAMSAAS